MANDGYVQVPPNSTGGKVDCASLSVSGQAVLRQRIVISDNTHSANYATVTGGGLNVNPSAVAVSGTAVVTGTVNIGNTVAVSGTIDKISATVAVSGNVTVDKISATAVAVIAGFLDPSGQQRNLVDSANLALRVNVVAGSGSGANPVSLAAGTANIGFINNISATVVAQVTSLPANLGTVNNISAAVSVTLPANIGTVNNISAAVVLAAGTNNIGSLNNISATVVSQVTSLPANIGTVNNISAAVVLAAGTNNIGTLNNISANVNVVLQAGTNNIGIIQAISATAFAVVAGPVGVNASITAGNAPVLAGGRVKTSASTTATAHSAVFLWMDKQGRAIVQPRHPSLPPSATHGPKSVTLSASANTVLVASAGTAAIFVDSLLITSNLAAVTKVDCYTQNNSAAPEVSAYLGVGGGGFNREFDPPWQISAGQPLVGRLKPSASAQVIVCVHFHVGPA